MVPDEGRTAPYIWILVPILCAHSGPAPRVAPGLPVVAVPLQYTSGSPGDSDLSDQRGAGVVHCEVEERQLPRMVRQVVATR